jgi:hypothetical protein
MSSSSNRFSAAELEDARMTYLTNYNHRSMNCGRGSAEIVTVAGTSKFQDSLRKAATAPRPWRHEYDRHLPALLAREPGEPATVAALIDGNIVGYLGKETAEQHIWAIGLALYTGCRKRRGTDPPAPTSIRKARPELTRKSAMRAPAPVIMLVLASIMVLAGCEPYPHRSAAEYVSPALYRAVTVTAVIWYPGRPHTVSRRFTSAAVVTELADTLNRAPAAPARLLPCSCPGIGAGKVEYYQLTFETAPGELLTLQAYDGCCSFGVSVWGKPSPGCGGPASRTSRPICLAYGSCLRSSGWNHQGRER